VGELQIQTIVAWLATYAIQWAKHAPWFPVMEENATRFVKVVFSSIVAAGSALAVTFSFDPTLGRLTIDGLTWANVAGGLWAFLWSLFVQHSSYRLLVKPNGGR